jgi:hypothetical protein
VEREGLQRNNRVDAVSEGGAANSIERLEDGI